MVVRVAGRGRDIAVYTLRDKNKTSNMADKTNLVRFIILPKILSDFHNFFKGEGVVLMPSCLLILNIFSASYLILTSFTFFQSKFKSTGLPGGGINIFAAILHTHLAGNCGTITVSLSYVLMRISLVGSATPVFFLLQRGIILTGKFVWNLYGIWDNI